jgi:MYXO-CTERM domain-containing protein
VIALLLGSSSAVAARPTDLVGLFAFDATDVIETWDEPTGDVRVHYSVSGPNVTDLDDDDASGVPDYVEQAGTFGAEALALYVATGFLHPVREAEVGLGDLGGSQAFDLYLVDFGGQADGYLSVDRCQDGRCATALVVENDFNGYGYPSDEVALETVVPHELFHAVQAAYTEDLESWTSEGTATWAERLFRPGSADFLRLAGAWFDEPTRSIDDPPVGPVPAFAYGTALWFDFLVTRHDPQLVVEVLESRSTAAGSDLDVVLGVLDDRGDDLRDLWTTFSAWNLATRELAGAAESYSYARMVGPPLLEDEGRVLDDDNRFYPLATTYYRLDHRGGEVWFGLAEAAPGLAFALHGVDAEGRVLDAALTFDGADPTPRSLGELPAGDWYLWGSQPIDGAESIKVRFCAGPEEDVLACFAPEPTTTPTDTAADTGEDGGGGCGCATGGVPHAPLALLGLLALRRRR